jgi:hypothetical protein
MFIVHLKPSISGSNIVALAVFLPINDLICFHQDLEHKFLRFGPTLLYSRKNRSSPSESLRNLSSETPYTRSTLLFLLKAVLLLKIKRFILCVTKGLSLL